MRGFWLPFWYLHTFLGRQNCEIDRIFLWWSSTISIKNPWWLPSQSLVYHRSHLTCLNQNMHKRYQSRPLQILLFWYNLKPKGTATAEETSSKKSFHTLKTIYPQIILLNLPPKLYFTIIYQTVFQIYIANYACIYLLLYFIKTRW